MHRYIYLLFFILLFGGLKAKETIISGKLPNATPGEYIRLIAYRDFISWDAYTLTGTLADDQGNFVLKADVKDVMYVQIDAGFRRVDFYLEPGRQYDIILKKQLLQETSSYGQNNTLSLEIRSPENSLTAQIGEINDLYNSFMSNRIQDSYGRMSRKLAGELETILTEKAGETAHPYAQDYAGYIIASLKLMSGSQSKNNLAVEYLAGQPILYDNIEYMGFFHSFFSKFLISTPSIVSTQDLFRLVNEELTYKPLLDTMLRAGYLNDIPLRELVLIKNLQELYFFPGFNQSKVLLFLEQLSTRASSVENRMIAANTAKAISRGSTHEPAPKTELTDFSGKTIPFPPSPGKYTYLCLIDPGQLASLAELNILPEIIKTHSDRVTFVCVNAVAGDQVFKNLAQHNPNGPIYALPKDLISLISNYPVTRLPWFILIDRKGNISANPAPSPSEDLAGYLNRMLKD
ncbi:MAG: hypothetical protein KKA81_00615 [Bacteroidetes bacterium]|nr:hypothetical protein [Bacteroidota bacterium]